MSAYWSQFDYSELMSMQGVEVDEVDYDCEEIDYNCEEESQEECDE